jgi:hypothetical protein
MWPDSDEGGPGFYNDENLVRRGYLEWRARNFGVKPTKQEIENLDDHWNHDMDTMASLVQYAKDIKEYSGAIGGNSG